VAADSYDDFDSVMKKLELSAASLAEVAANKERNVDGSPAGQSLYTITYIGSLYFSVTPKFYTKQPV